MTDLLRDRPPHKGYPGQCPESWSCAHHPVVMIEVQEDIATRSLVQLVECLRCGSRWTKRIAYDVLENWTTWQ